MKKLSTLLFALLCTTALMSETRSICELSCYAYVNYSMDVNCEALVTVEDIIYNACPEAVLSVSIEDGSGNPVSNPVTGSYVGDTLVVFITDAITGNACWSEIIIEDKIAPVIESVTVVDRACEDDFILPDIEASDNCDPFPIIILDYLLDCHPCTPQQITYTIQAQDQSGNASDPVVIYEFISDFCPAVVYPQDIILPCGSDISPEILGDVVIVDAETCSDGYEVTYTDEATTCGVIRHWTLTETCSGRSETHDQIITFVDTSAPTIVFTSNSSISLRKWNNGFDITYDVFDNCGEVNVILLTEDLTPISCDPVSFNFTRTYKLIDECGNFSIVPYTLNVSANNTPSVKVKGQKDCSNPFTVKAKVKKMVLPLTYAWSSSNPSWSVTPGPDNTATVTPGSGTTFIEATVTDAIGCVVSDDKKFKCNNNAKGSDTSTTRSQNDQPTTFFPNPTSDISSILLNRANASKLDLRVHNYSGELITHEDHQLRKGDNQINLSMGDWDSGVYFVQLIMQDQIISQKIVKQ